MILGGRPGHTMYHISNVLQDLATTSCTMSLILSIALPLMAMLCLPLCYLWQLQQAWSGLSEPTLNLRPVLQTCTWMLTAEL